MMTPQEWTDRLAAEAVRKTTEQAPSKAETLEEYAAAHNALIAQLEVDGEIDEGSVPTLDL